MPLRLRIFWVGFAGTCNVLLYGCLNRAPLATPVVTPHIALDDVTPFLPWTMAPYLILFSWVFVLAPFASERRAFVDMMRAFVTAIVLNFTIWMLWPTYMPRPADPGDVVGADLWRLFTSVDHDNNALPSGHVTIPLISAWGFVRSHPRMRAAIALAFVLLVPSILTTKQHTVADLAAGLATAVVGIAVAVVVRRRFPRA